MHINSICAKEIKENRTTHPHILPIYPTASFAFESIDQGIDIFSGNEKGHFYSRYGNPTNDTVAKKIAKLESLGVDCEAGAIMLSSGMAAVTTLMMSLVKSGDKVLTQSNLYGGTNELFVKVLQPLGVEMTLMDLHDLERVEDYLKKNRDTKVMYLETPANPTMACVDLEALGVLAQKYGVKTAIDNTFSTPYLQQPFKFGIDFIIHSTTKFLNGHGNSISGIVIAKDASWVNQGGQIWKTMKLLGTNGSPWDAWLVNNGLKTLGLRMERHSSNALEIAKRLEAHNKIAKVNYCGLESHPDYLTAKKQMRSCGGMMSFELKGGFDSGIKFMNAIKMCTLAPTLGDVDTLILHPVSMSHRGIPKEQRLKAGITDGLIRLSTGIEHIEDIWGDLEQALEKA